MEHDLKGRIGTNVGWYMSDYHDVNDIIDELESFVEQFDTHAMSEHALYKQGQKAAYKDVIEYLKRVRGDE